jgi:ADP-heptose:LPS heptosyltransferase
MMRRRRHDIKQILPADIFNPWPDNIDQLCQLFRGAAAVIGNDTGPVFLAARMGAPTVMVMGKDTDPLMSAPVGEKQDGFVRSR